MNYRKIFCKYRFWCLFWILMGGAAGSFLGATVESHLPLPGKEAGQALYMAADQNRWYNFIGAVPGALLGLLFYALCTALIVNYRKRRHEVSPD